MGGHLGEGKTLEKVKERFYWPGYHNDVKNWVNTCSDCAARKTPSPRNRAALQSIKVRSPMQLVAIDILGPLYPSLMQETHSSLLWGTTSPVGWKHITFQTKKPLATVAKKLTDEFFFCFSPPEQLHLDQGRQFESQLIAEICKLL